MAEEDRCDIQKLTLEDNNDKPPTIPLRGPTSSSQDSKVLLQKNFPECLPNFRAITSYLSMSKECEIKSSMTKLEDHLFIGGQSATSRSLLEQYKITHIVNTV